MSSDRDLNLPITAEDFTRRATDTAASNFERLQRKVDGFSTSKPSREMEAFGRLLTVNLKDGESAWQTVQREIAATQVKLHGMRQELARGGSASLFGDVRKTEADLKHLEAILGSMAAEGAKVGQTFSSGFTAGAAETLGQDLPALFTPAGAIGAGIIVNVATLLTPVLVAGLAAAVTTGVGVGVLGLGALIAQKSPVVVSALAHLKADATAALSDAASPLEQPIADALASLDEMIVKDGPELRKMFAAVAPLIGLATHALEGLAEGVLPDLVDDAESFADIFRDPQVQAQLRLIAGQLLDIVHQLSANPQLAKDFFTGMLVTVNLLLAPLDLLVRGVSILDTVLHHTVLPPWLDAKPGKDLAAWHDGAESAARGIDDLSSSLAAADPAIESGADAIRRQAQQLHLAVGAVAAYQRSVADMTLGAILGADRATLGWSTSLTDLTERLKHNKHNIDIHKKAGQEDRGATLDAVSANIQLYDSMINSGFSAKDAAKAYDKNTAALRKTLRDAGLGKKQIDGLIGAYEKVPDSVSTNVILSGLDKTLSHLSEVLEKIYGIEGDHVANVKVKYTYTGLDAGGRLRGGGHIAFGGGGPQSWQALDYAVKASGAAQTGVTEAARPISVASTITSRLVLDGRVIDERVQRVVEAGQRADRAGWR